MSFLFSEEADGLDSLSFGLVPEKCNAIQHNSDKNVEPVAQPAIADFTASETSLPSARRPAAWIFA